VVTGIGPFAAGINAAAWTLIGLRSAIRHNMPTKKFITLNNFMAFIVKPPLLSSNS
jgi:hypothetical protein